MQTVTITTKVVSLNSAHGDVHLIQPYVIKFVGDLQQVRRFSPVSSINTTDRHDYNLNIVESGIKHKNPNPFSSSENLLSYCLNNI